MLHEYIILFIFGLVFGSFIGAVTWRIPNSLSFVKGRSICPNCKSKISWFDNIPLFAYLFLGGKCRNCKKKISFRYFLIELLTGLGFVLVGMLTLPNFTLLIYYLIIFVLMELIFVIDYENQYIPDSIVFLGIIFIFFLSPIITHQQLFTFLFSGFLASSFLLLIHIVTRGRGMGLGDVKFAVLGGMFLGLKLMPIWLLMAFLTGGIVGSILILIGKAKMKTKIAFGPFLVFGLALAIVFGDKIISLMRLY